MSQAAPRPLIIGNWKMYKTIPEAIEFVKKLIPIIASSPSEVYLAVPFTTIHPLSEEAKGSSLVIGAQNMNDASEGAFTGEIAAKMLTQAGAQFVVLGHSERRRLFHEDNGFINRKVIRALIEGLRPVLCIGESQEEHDEKRTEEIVKNQLKECLEGINPINLANLVVAYEPVWAIGTSNSATPEYMQNIQKVIREFLTELLGDKNAKKVAVLYGGSLNPKNSKELLQNSDIDGLLVGGASLSLETFVEIVNDSCKQINEAAK